MSSAASWSYNQKATHWPLLTRGEWGGTLTFGPPKAFDCDVLSDQTSQQKERGDEFTAQLTLYTEKADIRLGDRVARGVSALADPNAAGALPVQRIKRYADIFEMVRDDFEVQA